MRLILPVPENCPRRELDPARSLVFLEGSEEQPAVTLLLYHPHVPRMSFVEYSSEMTRMELPPGTAAEMKWANGENRHGWWTQLVHTVIAPPGDLPPLELRLTAVFNFRTFQSMFAAAIARVHQPERFVELKPRLEQLLHAARPDWRGVHAPSLAELLD